MPSKRIGSSPLLDVKQKDFSARLMAEGGITPKEMTAYLNRVGFQYNMATVRRWKQGFKQQGHVGKIVKNVGKRRVLTEKQRRIVAGCCIEQYLAKEPNDTLAVKDFITQRLGIAVNERFIQRLC
jgi:transposase